MTRASTLFDVLQELRSLDVRLSLDGERLTLSAPKGVLPERLRAAVSARKAEIIAFLRDARESQHRGFVLEPAPGDRSPPLSFAQQRLWFLHQLDPANPAYNLGIVLESLGSVDVPALTRALHEVAGRHQILRSVFRVSDGIPSQIVTDTRPRLRIVDLEASSGESPIAALLRLREAEARTPFDLASAPPIRALLVRFGPSSSALVIVLHHILADGWSLGILVKELEALYEAFSTGGAARAEPLPWQYADYAYSQRLRFSESTERVSAEFWKRTLSGSLPSIDLPVDRPRGRVLGSRGTFQAFTLPADVTQALRSLSTSAGVTLFSTMQSLFKVLLHRYSGQTDIVIGAPFADRPRTELEPLIGLFVSTMVLRTDLSGDPTMRELLWRVHQGALEAFEHRDYPFEKIVDLARPDRNLAHTPLFQVAFVFHNTPFTRPSFTTILGGATFELNLNLWDGGSDLPGSIEYNADLFDAGTITRMAGHLRTLAESAVANPDQPISRLAMLSTSERTQLTETWNSTALSAPPEGVHTQFERQADASPDAVAIIAPSGEGKGAASGLTYGELDRHADRMAERLRRAGVGPGTMVAIVLDRSVEFVTAALGTLKAGAAYVPIDATLPAERLAALLADAAPVALVTRADLRHRLPPTDAALVQVDDVGAPTAPLRRRPASRMDPGEPAYVMYTSGSTGQPKGVTVPHRAVVRLARDTTGIGLSASDVVLACAPVSFDASTYEIWGCLLNGGCLVIYPRAVPEPAELARLLAAHSVTTLWLTAGLFHLVTETRPECFAGLRRLLAGGDVLSPSHVRKALRALSGGELINGYGPTENTTFTCCHRMTEESEIGERVPIGRPISGTRVYVLDRSMQPVPVGVRGELWVGGDGLALGYLNDPVLTTERFLPDPFSSDPGGRLYRTGDMVRWRANGELEFLGRTDGQIKIRGFRVEPSEIEHALCRHPEVRDAVVVARMRAGGDKTLIGYVVTTPSSAVTPESLRAFLQQALPEYAVPAFYVSLPTFPLNPNGKVDHSALPPPPEGDAAQDESHSALETQLAVVWEQVLGLNGVGRRDNFFDLGGNSLLGIRLLATLEKTLRMRIPVAVLFEGQTIESMAAALQSECVNTSFRAVAIRSGGSATPLFVVPGVNGDVFGYQGLASALGPDQPLYCLRSRGLDGESPPWETVEEIATEVISEMRRIQPDGPYRVMGFCMGGIVAFEVARRLAAEGQTPELLVMVETYPPSAIQRRRRLSKLALKGVFLLAGALRHVRAARRQPAGERLTYLREKSRILSDMVAQRDVYRGNRHILQRELVSRSNQRAAASYVPSAYPGDILMVLAREPKGPGERDQRLVWKTLTEGGWTEIRIPSKDSGFLLKEPLVRQIADLLRRARPVFPSASAANGTQPSS